MIAGFVAIAVLLMYTPNAHAADRGVVTASDVRIRSGPSTSTAVVTTLARRTEVTVLGRQNGWVQVVYGNKTGFIREDLIGVLASTDVSQQSQTVTVPTASSALTVLKTGDTGNDVYRLQAALHQLGYLSVSPTGNFASMTRSALVKYQAANGLSPDGVAWPETLSKLYSGSSSVTAPAQQPAMQTITQTQMVTQYVYKGLSFWGTPEYDTIQVPVTTTVTVPVTQNQPTAPQQPAFSAPTANGSVEWIGWNPGGDAAFIKKTAALVTDVRTGVQFYVRRFSGSNHADVETLTASDTQTLFQLYGGKWDWTARPVWVTVGGRTFAASINGMPHGTDTLPDNGMQGQICIHLPGSRTHNGNTSYEYELQKAIVEAYTKAR